MRPDRPARAGRIARVVGGLVALALAVVVGTAWWSSLRPDTYSALAMGVADIGGGAVIGGGGHGHGAVGDPASPDASAVSVTELTADPMRPADVHVELRARAERVTLPGGDGFDGYTLNGSTPGPEIRARQGQMVEVLLRNESVPGGVTLHWHGIDVPGAMDGVAGVTQDAVAPGEVFTYRFVAEQAGTYWYHSHQVSHEQVHAGLFGAIVIEPAADGADAGTGEVPPGEAPAAAADAVVLLHTYPGTSRTLNGVAGEVRHGAAPGAHVRVRIANTDSTPTAVWAEGGFRVVAVDGTDVHEPGLVEGRKVRVTAGGRIDLEVVVPATGAVRVQAPGVSLLVGPDDATAPTPPSPPEFLDLLDYGTPAPLGFDPERPDRSFAYDIGRAPGFLAGVPGIWWTINGRMGDDVPMFMVREGDVVAMRITNGSGEVHPMHLHGHHVVVLARNGVPASGSPWWVDSLDVDNGESYDVAFVADNPGLWADHCHTLPHAVEGLMTHLMYEGVTTPFLLGAGSGNEPE
ncbi:multicopper oxidase family protein [Agrococcus carbonis]|uniref:Multicopper oxidase with three cupredoxin domains (Includes cell division protein FtsP and spore coat protein CotA) n=1 Tax=Agrococcus carbonis TaxID=684552 RepID=A0A1H1LXP9_9MICO|nr:multicopper oxidase family protein [Agrococcus carbonis]SDR79042.1 Multicopper oxidase with three cupredoxin domains (includes cell division protein FtsP and spore coat protein CotA) [Agrococcus carbonis]